MQLLHGSVAESRHCAHAAFAYLGVRERYQAHPAPATILGMDQ